MSKPGEQLKCQRKGCKYTTNRAYNLERHQRNHEKGWVPVSQCQPCPHCTYAAGSVHNLRRHISKRHPTLTAIKNESNSELNTDIEEPKQSEQKQCTQPSQTTVDENSGKTEDYRHSLWHWNTPQQQGRNFQRRYNTREEVKILERKIKLYKLFALVKARGGGINVDNWDIIANALGLPNTAGRLVRDKYMKMLFQYEKKEEDRLRECEGIPPWWDDGDVIIDTIDYKQNDEMMGCHWWLDKDGPSVTVRNAILKLIYNKYYVNHVNNTKPFQRFQVKDSWLRAAMLNYQELICQLHSQHYKDS